VTRSITQEDVIVAGIPAKIIAERPSAPKLNINGLETVEKIPGSLVPVEAPSITRNGQKTKP
jgi:hypothetical protein